MRVAIADHIRRACCTSASSRTQLRFCTSASAPATHRLLIGGKLLDAENGRKMPVINPATNAAFAHVPDAGADDAIRAITAAEEAFSTWGRTPLSERAACLTAFSDALEKRADEFAEAVTLEQGKPLVQARSEVTRVVNIFRHIAKIGDIPPERVPENADIELQYVPRGVVAAIQPWNFPLAMAGKQIGPAVGTGNTVVVKPSSHTPLSTVMLGTIAKDTFPPGVVNIISGSRAAGEQLLTHPSVRHVSFVGSIPTGQYFMEKCAPTLKKITFELGGNDPAIILPGSDISKLAPQIFDIWMFNCGQVCTTIKRLYVHESQYQEMVARLADLAKAAASTLGDGLRPDTMIGPLNNKSQLELVADLVDDARQHGASIVAGGRRVSPAEAPDGYFYEPTVVADVDDTARIVVEEQFGPVLPILSYSDVGDAVRRANNSEFGLGGSVWGPDDREAAKVLSELEVGIAWLNCHNEGNIHTPWGAVKLSGLGVGGDAIVNSLKEYTEMKTVWLPK